MVLAIAEAGSVTKAAAVLGVAQPALTTQLQRIERILGGALFIRDRRGVLIGLAQLAGERWITAPGDGCFHECFAAACAREGFAPHLPTEIDASSAFDLVAGGTAIALCQGTVRNVPGTVAVPLRGVPLRWRHLLGWDPERPAAAQAAEVLGYAVEAYIEIVGRRPRYSRWLAGHPELGVHKTVSPLSGHSSPARSHLANRSDPLIA